jgi:hypothetical protein
MKQAGFQVAANAYFLDDSEGVEKPREIDIRAWNSCDLSIHDECPLLEMQVAVECKVSKVPWVGFVDFTSLPGDLALYPVLQVFGTQQARLGVQRLLVPDEALPVARGLTALHSSLVAMAENGKDLAFEAMAKVITGARALAKDVRAGRKGERAILLVVFPAIFVDGPLISCCLGESGEVELEEVDRMMLRAYGFASNADAVLIPVVTRRGVPAFAADLANTTSTLLERAKQNPYFFASPP